MASSKEPYQSFSELGRNLTGAHYQLWEQMVKYLKKMEEEKPGKSKDSMLMIAIPVFNKALEENIPEEFALSLLSTILNNLFENRFFKEINESNNEEMKKLLNEVIIQEEIWDYNISSENSAKKELLELIIVNKRILEAPIKSSRDKISELIKLKAIKIIEEEDYLENKLKQKEVENLLKLFNMAVSDHSQLNILKNMHEIMAQLIKEKPDQYFSKNTNPQTIEKEKEAQAKFLKSLEEGHCSGLSIYYGICKLNQDSQYFFNMLNLIGSCNGNLDNLTTDQIKEIEYFFSQIVFLHSYSDKYRTKEQIAEDYGKEIKHLPRSNQLDYVYLAKMLGSNLESSGPISNISNRKEFCKKLENSSSGTSVLIATENHALCIYIDKEKETGDIIYFYYDPNQPSGEIVRKDLNEIIKLIEESYIQEEIKYNKVKIQRIKIQKQELSKDDIDHFFNLITKIEPFKMIEEHGNFIGNNIERICDYLIKKDDEDSIEKLKEIKEIIRLALFSEIKKFDTSNVPMYFYTLQLKSKISFYSQNRFYNDIHILTALDRAEDQITDYLEYNEFKKKTEEQTELKINQEHKTQKNKTGTIYRVESPEGNISFIFIHDEKNKKENRDFTSFGLGNTYTAVEENVPVIIKKKKIKNKETGEKITVSHVQIEDKLNFWRQQEVNKKKFDSIAIMLYPTKRKEISDAIGKLHKARSDYQKAKKDLSNEQNQLSKNLSYNSTNDNPNEEKESTELDTKKRNASSSVTAAERELQKYLDELNQLKNELNKNKSLNQTRIQKIVSCLKSIFSITGDNSLNLEIKKIQRALDSQPKKLFNQLADSFMAAVRVVTKFFANTALDIKASIKNLPGYENTWIHNRLRNKKRPE
jgi:hypothetical protein